MLQPGQILLHPASTFFISIFASFHQAHSPAVLEKLKRVDFLLKMLRTQHLNNKVCAIA
jgi:hypothetical protein